MDAPADVLTWIDSQHDRVVELVCRWASINSHTDNLPGLARMADVLQDAFAPLGGTLKRHALPPREVVDRHGNVARQPVGQALSIVKRPDATRRVLLCIHMDTVYPADSPFQEVTWIDNDTLRGPGVADAKGGIAVILLALEAFERSDVAEGLGWEVLLNPDEEIGSPSSIDLLQQAARRNHVGLVYEPTLPDGTLIGQRKGSGNFTLVVRGRSAHAGRAVDEGRNAIHLLAELIGQVAALHGARPGLTVNVGIVEGGSAVNRVPDMAIAHLNVRVEHAEDPALFVSQLDSIVAEANARDGFHVERHGAFFSPPKPLDPPTQRLLETIADCGRGLGLDIKWQSSGGVCDGNKLAAAGLPNVDTLGPRGGDIHSPREYLIVPSLCERAKLTASLLMRWARGDDWVTG